MAAAVALRSARGEQRQRVGEYPRCGRAARDARTRCRRSVSVPVLSRHTTSTRASASTAGNSCTRVCRRASVSTPTRKARLVNSTRPSGTIPTSAATAPVTASCQVLLSLLANWLHSSTGPTTSISSDIQRSSLLVPDTSSEPVRVNLRASVASLTAYASAPTAVARNRPLPATTIEPERSWASPVLATGSDSPVSRDSSTSRPGGLHDDPVGHDLVAGAAPRAGRQGRRLPRRSRAARRRVRHAHAVR